MKQLVFERSAIKHNTAIIQERAGSAVIFAVLVGDAYGAGLVELAKLLREKRDVILLSYFMDMSDREIGELLDMARRTVQHRRTDTLAELRKRMEDDDD